MAYVSVTEQLLQDAASRTRAKLGTAELITPRELAGKIQEIDACRRMDTTSVETSGRYGMRAAEVAESYVAARWIGHHYWNYNANGSIFDSYDEDNHEMEIRNFLDASAQSQESEDPDDDPTVEIEDQTQFAGYDPMVVNGKFRLYAYATKPFGKCPSFDADGKIIPGSAPIQAAIDCSTFVSLALRGIPYEASPWAVYGVQQTGKFYWTPANIVGMTGTEGWEQREIDLQPAGLYNDIGVDGHSSLRTAADFAEFYYKTGRVLYDRPIHKLADRSRNQPTAAEIIPLLQPGDLLFFSGVKTDDDGTERLTITNRFRCVSHIAIISRDARFLVEVTNGKTTFPNAVYYREIKDAKLRGLTLVIRPDYRPRAQDVSTPPGENQLSYPWTYSRRDSYTTNGLTFQAKGENRIQVSGKLTATWTITLRGSTSAMDAGLWLSAGTYRAALNADTNIGSTGFALQVRHADGFDFAPAVRAYDNSDATFTLTAPERVIVRLYCGSGLVNQAINETIEPTITRLS